MRSPRVPRLRASIASASRQRGAALFIILLLIVVSAGIVFVSRLKSAAVDLDAQRKTAVALAEAKSALLGYAASDANKPGSLPCPDANNDGESKPIDDYSGATCVVAVGRLPWKTLGLSDLRDGAGERLWYAVSPKFAANATSPLNSTVAGQITVRDANGNIVSNGQGATGVVAVIIAPGPALIRQGQAASQDRSCTAGVNCNAMDVCTTASPFTATPKCNPANYLDVVVALEDNADFQAGTLNGFILGPVKDVTDPTRMVVNDAVFPITRRDVMNVTTSRMAGELRALLTSASYPMTMPALPAWATANQWDTVMSYARGMMGTTATLGFSPCSTAYTLQWDGSTGSTVITAHSGTC